MKPNISIFDTIIRLFIAALWAGIFGALGSFVAVLALYPFVTSLIAWDPVYKAMGKYTCDENPYLEDDHGSTTVVRQMPGQLPKSA